MNYRKETQEGRERGKKRKIRMKKDRQKGGLVNFLFLNESLYPGDKYRTKLIKAFKSGVDNLKVTAQIFVSV